MTDLKYICSSLKNKRYSKGWLVQERKLFEAKRMLWVYDDLPAEFFRSAESRLDFYRMYFILDFLFLKPVLSLSKGIKEKEKDADC